MNKMFNISIFFYCVFKVKIQKLFIGILLVFMVVVIVKFQFLFLIKDFVNEFNVDELVKKFKQFVIDFFIFCNCYNIYDFIVGCFVIVKCFFFIEDIFEFYKDFEDIIYEGFVI